MNGCIMKIKTTKAQLSVWETKERLSAELLKLPENERVAYIIRKAKPAIDALKREKKAC